MFGYKLNGKKINYFPQSESDQKNIIPIYETHKGWEEKTKGAKSWSSLPALAIKYVRRVEELLGVQVSLLSTSPKREDTILVKILLLIEVFTSIINIFDKLF